MRNGEGQHEPSWRTTFRIVQGRTLEEWVMIDAQETSGVALNYYLLVRHRTPYHASVLSAQIVFGATFFVWRLVLGTYGTYHFLKHSGQHLPAVFPVGAARALGVALVLASCLQWFWGMGIIKMVMRKMDQLKLKKLRDEEDTTRKLKDIKSGKAL